MLKVSQPANVGHPDALLQTDHLAILDCLHLQIHYRHLLDVAQAMQQTHRNSVIGYFHSLSCLQKDVTNQRLLRYTYELPKLKEQQSQHESVLAEHGQLAWYAPLIVDTCARQLSLATCNDQHNAGVEVRLTLKQCLVPQRQQPLASYDQHCHGQDSCIAIKLDHWMPHDR